MAKAGRPLLPQTDSLEWWRQSGRADMSKAWQTSELLLSSFFQIIIIILYDLLRLGPGKEPERVEKGEEM